MTTKLHAALERLDGEIDQLETAVSAMLLRPAKKAAKAEETVNRADLLDKLDGMIGKLETVLKT